MIIHTYVCVKDIFSLIGAILYLALLLDTIDLFCRVSGPKLSLLITINPNAVRLRVRRQNKIVKFKADILNIF